MAHEPRTAAHRMADTAVSMLGAQGMRRYSEVVRFLLPGHSPRTRALRSRVLSLPAARSAVLRIKGSPVAFDYGTSPFDDLQRVCREDLLEWEPVSRWFFYLAARTSTGVVDVGAYSGVYAITAALASLDVEVHAFEPNPAMRELAAANITRNRLGHRVNLHSVAASDTSGTATLYLPHRDSSTASLVSQDGEGIEVTTATLDSVLGDRQIDLIKMDVEGAEPAVLRGARGLLLGCQPLVLTEALTASDLEQQRDVLEPLGYQSPIAVDTASGHGDARNYVWATASTWEHATNLLDQARSSART